MNNINLYLLLATGRFEPFIKDIKREFFVAQKKIIEKIPVHDIDVVIYDNPEGTILELGIGGYSPNDHLVFISLNPQLANFQEIIKTQLARIMVHEFYHCLRWKNPGFGKTLFEVLITEGLADHFDIEVNNQPSQPWDNALTDRQEKNLLRRASKEFNNKNYSHQDWFFGNPKRKIPRWTGYTLGFNLVGEYLKKHLKTKASLLYEVKAKEFIR